MHFRVIPRPDDDDVRFDLRAGAGGEYTDIRALEVNGRLVLRIALITQSRNHSIRTGCQIHPETQHRAVDRVRVGVDIAGQGIGETVSRAGAIIDVVGSENVARGRHRATLGKLEDDGASHLRELGRSRGIDVEVNAIEVDVRRAWVVDPLPGLCRWGVDLGWRDRRCYPIHDG